MKSFTRKTRIPLSIILILILALAPLFPLPAAALEYPDNPSPWALETVRKGISLGLVPEGLRAGYTKPLTRAELYSLGATLMEKITGQRITDYAAFNKEIFNDENVTDISKAVLTREQACAILVKLMKELRIPLIQPASPLSRTASQTTSQTTSQPASPPSQPTSLQRSAFADESSISPWALEAVGQIYAMGIMKGTGNNKFEPKGEFSREQGICVLTKLYDLALASNSDADILKAYIAEEIRLVNIERIKAGVAPLSIDEGLMSAAAKRAAELEASFSHTRPGGKKNVTIITDDGIEYTAFGENLAKGHTSPQDVVDGLLASTTHKKNILNTAFNKIGAGIHKDASGTLYWTQLFMN